MSNTQSLSNTQSPPSSRTVDGRPVPPAGTYRLDAAHTTVDFVVRHLMVSKVRGTFSDVEGRVVVGEDPAGSSIEAVIKMASVTTRDDARDTHLRSADFFDIERFPEMTFRASSLRPGRDLWTADGELTIRGVSRQVPLSVEFLGANGDPWGGFRAGFSATTEIDREDFGLTWNAAIESGGVVVGKSIKIEIEAELVLES